MQPDMPEEEGLLGGYHGGWALGYAFGIMPHCLPYYAVIRQMAQAYPGRPPELWHRLWRELEALVSNTCHH